MAKHISNAAARGLSKGFGPSLSIFEVKDRVKEHADYLVRAAKRAIKADEEAKQANERAAAMEELREFDLLQDEINHDFDVLVTEFEGEL